MLFPKSKPVRSEAYRRWIASLPCFCCGISGWSQCAHANGGGMGTKASDLESFPLCATRPGDVGCHMRFDLCIDIDKAERRELTEQYVRRAQQMAREAGRREFEKEAA